MDDSRKKIHELLDEQETLLRRLNENYVKIKKLTAEVEKLTQNVPEKESTTSTSGDHNRATSPRSAPFCDPFIFIEDMHNAVQDDKKLFDDTNAIIGDFFNGVLSEEDVLTQMSSLCSKHPDIISGVKLFLATPVAVSRARTIYQKGTAVMIMVANRFGYDSQVYRNFFQILESDKNNQSEMHYLHKQLEELFENECDLKDATKKLLKELRELD